MYVRELALALSALLSAILACPSDECRCSSRGVVVCSHRHLEMVPHFSEEPGTTYTQLDLSQNDIYSVPPEAFRRLSIKYIILSNNPLIGISPRAFDGIEGTVERLDLHSASLNVLHWAVFRNLNHLTELNMADNSLFAIPPGLFVGMTQLKTLSFEGNAIGSIKQAAFDGLVNLQELDLSNNQITAIDDFAFECLSQLGVLSLKGNEISSLNYRAISGLDSLRELHLDGNRLSALSPSTFSFLPALTTVSLQNNNLTSLLANSFVGAPAIQKLYLDHNQLQNISNEAFFGIKVLRTLSLDDNRLEGFGAQCSPHGLENLASLRMADNPLNCNCRLSWVYTLIMSGTFVDGHCATPSNHKDVLLRQLNFTMCLKSHASHCL